MLFHSDGFIASEWSYVYQDNGDRLFQGDIVLPEWAETAEAYVGRNALINRERLWPNATIPYQISDVYGDEIFSFLLQPV